jgi:hypothetical protein
MPIRSTILLFAIACAVAAPVQAGFQVLDWHLTAALSDHSGDLPIIDGVDITQVSNPLNTTSLAQIGTNFATATYDHSWIESLAWGDFNTSFTHQIRTPEVKTVADSRIVFTPTEPVHVTLDGQTTYSHTPGDLDSISFGFEIQDADTLEDFVLETRRGGNLYFQPASATINLHAETVLPADRTYQFQLGLQSDNISDNLPTGILDASGYVNFSIRPVPEPGVVLLIGPMVLVFARGLRCRSSGRQVPHVRRTWGHDFETQANASASRNASTRNEASTLHQTTGQRPSQSADNTQQSPGATQRRIP